MRRYVKRTLLLANTHPPSVCRTSQITYACIGRDLQPLISGERAVQRDAEDALKRGHPGQRHNRGSVLREPLVFRAPPKLCEPLRRIFVFDALDKRRSRRIRPNAIIWE